MTIAFIIGDDIFASSTDVLVNPVNCVGVMGKGLALSFKNKFPDMYKQYKKDCHDGKVVIGRINVYSYFEEETLDQKYIFNFPTKKHWKDNSNLAEIEEGIKDLLSKIEEYQIDSIAIPRIGCGLGGLDWEADVQPLLYKYFEEFSNTYEKDLLVVTF